MNEIISYVTTDLIFDIEPKTANFIRERYHGDVTVAMDFEPMLDSGCKCSAAREVAGCYVPRIYAGAPSGDTDHYLLWQAGDVKLFYSVKLRPKPYANRIRIRLRSFLFMKWLEIEGARAIVVAPAEHPMPKNPRFSPFQKEERSETVGENETV